MEQNLPPLGDPVPSRCTYDIFERLQNLNEIQRPDPAVDSDDDSEVAEGDQTYQLGLRYIWAENGRRVCVLGKVLRGAAESLRVADNAFPRDTAPRPPWTFGERMLEDNMIPFASVYTREEVVHDGYREVVWPANVALPFIDRTSLVMAVGAGSPQRPDAAKLVEAATRAFQLAAEIADAPVDGYISITHGIQYLEGEERPQNIPDLSRSMQEYMALYCISKHEAFVPFYEFTNAAFEAFSPMGYAVTRGVHERLMASNPSLERVTLGPWTNVDFDLGLQTVTVPLSGPADAPRWGWIAITAFGSFDPVRGGQLILWDLGWYLQFPAGRTFFLPAIMRYSIAAIQPGETRFSLTQYSVAGPTWSRWPAATHLFSTADELAALRAT